MKLSVIVPIYNSFDKMGKSLEILSLQKCLDIELILVDDCSSDNSYELALEFAKIAAFEVKVIKNETNIGPGKSRNLGLQLATGKYITFLDSDDYFAENFSEKILPELEKDVDCVIFDYKNVKEDGTIISLGKTMQNHTTGNMVDVKKAFVYIAGSTWGKVYKLKKLVDNSICFADLKRCEDMPFTKAAIAYSEKIVYLQDPLYFYVQQKESLMHNKALVDERNCQKAFQFLSQKICRLNFDEELEIVKLSEVLNNTVLIKLSKKTPKKEIKKYINDNYSKSYFSNKYFKTQSLKIKIVSYCVYYRLLELLKLMQKAKELIKNKQEK